MADLKVSFILEDFPEEYLEDDLHSQMKELIDDVAANFCAVASYIIVEES